MAGDSDDAGLDWKKWAVLALREPRYWLLLCLALLGVAAWLFGDTPAEWLATRYVPGKTAIKLVFECALLVVALLAFIHRLRDPFSWDTEFQCWRDRRSGRLYCAGCWAEGKKTPLRHNLSTNYLICSRGLREHHFPGPERFKKKGSELDQGRRFTGFRRSEFSS